MGLLYITPTQCGLDNKLYDREYCENCKDKVKPKEMEMSNICVYLILRNNEPNRCALNGSLCAKEEGENCEYEKYEQEDKNQMKDGE